MTRFTRVGADLVDVRTLRRRRDHVVTDARPLRGVEHRRGVAHRAGHGERHAEAGFVALGSHRDPTLRRFQADQAATRRRDANRSAAIGRVRDRDESGGDRRGRTAR